MANTRTDPYTSFNFFVEIDGVTRAGVSECSGLDAEIAVIEYREGADAAAVRKIPGLHKVGDVTLKRGVTQDRQLWDWFKDVRNGVADRRSVSIILLDSERNQVVRYLLSNAWPTKWEGPRLNAKSNEVAIETLVLTHEGLDLSE